MKHDKQPCEGSASIPPPAARVASGMRAAVEGASRTLQVCGVVILGAMLFAPAAPAQLAAGWGENRQGQLGNGTTVSSSIPVTVSGLSGVVAVSAGFGHSLGLLSDGTVRAWGDNLFGQLGSGYLPQSPPYGSILPVTARGLSGVTAIAAGISHSLALLSDGTVQIWGDNRYGQLGDGTISNGSPGPVPVNWISGVIAIAAGPIHSLALLSDGTVRAWGWNACGQLGIGTTNTSLIPVAVSGLSGVIAIATGECHSLALSSDGTVWGWGANPASGTTVSSYTPVPLRGLNGQAIAIAAGGWHSLALLRDGTVRAWGRNTFGQLGNGTNISSSTPVTVSGLTGVAAIAAGGIAGPFPLSIENPSAESGHSLALLRDGTVRAWGRNNLGQLGNGTTTDSSIPVATSGLSRVRAIAAGPFHSLAAVRLLIPPTTTSLEAPFATLISAPSGESVSLTGGMHVVTEVLIPPDPCPPFCEVSATVHINLDGVSGVGQTSGLLYHATGASTAEAVFARPGTFVVPGQFRLHAPNPAVPPMDFTTQISVSVNSQGVVTGAEVVVERVLIM
jgi:hypothetical protein